MDRRDSLTKKEKVFLSNTRKRVGKAVHKYGLIEPGDRVLVAVSGGKDSLFLLDALGTQRKYFPFDFELMAIHVEVTDKPYAIDTDYLEYLCDLHDVELHYRQLATGDIEASGKSPCFLCSWQRRKVLFQAVEELAYPKLALGHHMDDAIETLLMNMTCHANISSLPPQLKMFEDKVTLIRPLLLTEERNITAYENIIGFPKELSNCPFEEVGNRYAVTKIIADLEKLNKNARVNLLRSMSNIDLDYLP